MDLLEAVEYIRNDEAHAAALAGIQEVREVLDGIGDDGCYDACWRRWGRGRRGDNQFHSDSCQRARALMEKLEVRP